MDFIDFEAEVDTIDDKEDFISSDDDVLLMTLRTYQKVFVNIMLFRMLT